MCFYYIIVNDAAVIYRKGRYIMKKEPDDFSSERMVQTGHPPTSRDVALRAGVSQSSVCRVFDSKWSDRISPALRERVLSAAKELGYSPNALARSLTANRSGIIGVVVSEDFNEFYYDLLRRITNELQQMDMRVMIFNAAPYREIKQVFQKLVEYRVDGIIATAAAISNIAEPFHLDRATPLVLVNIYSTEPFCDSVITDNYAGSNHMAQYLYGCGCRNFVYVSAEKSRYFDVPDRKRGFFDYIRLKKDASLRHIAGDYSYRSGQEIARELFLEPGRPDCVFCSGSRMAYGIMDVARFEFGIKIPEQLSIAAYDDMDASTLASYQLTAVQQQSDLLAHTAVQLLQKAIGGTASPNVETVYVPPTLVMRGSVRESAALDS